MTKIRTAQAPTPLTRAQFRERFNGRFYEPALEVERDAIARLEAIQAVKALRAGRLSQSDKQVNWQRQK